jgi:hypothetical protein
MPLVPGLNPAVRLEDDPENAAISPLDVTVEDAGDEPDIPEFDQDGAVLRIDHGDGSITVSLDGKPISEAEEEGDKGWFANLVDEIDDDELGRIADDLLRGVDDDLMSRKEWIEDRAQGVKLLGLKIEAPGLTGSADGAPVEGMSKVRHPLLQEAVLRFQANARSEMLPTDGPVKIRDDGFGATFDKDQLADGFEKDFNHYLTSTATEYYPDTDRMFLMLGFGGSAFKKVYFCPLRNRPVSESVDAEDLIVNNSATDLRNAKRVTHRVYMKPSTVKRLQILGVYRDVELATPHAPSPDSVQEAKAAQQGVSTQSMNPDDRDRELYEVYCELDVKGFEHKHKGKPSGLEIPYRVTIDVSSREILSIVRNYDEETKELPEARTTFVKYTFVPGFGFYDIGLLHILGNTTNAVTAAWRELLDAGMYANFPGFLISDSGSRQNTNVFRIPPGGASQVKTGGLPINQAVMPLPYKEPSQALMALTENIAATGMRVGGTSELQVGEGRPDAPVGTTLAMIEQATKILNSVHKRMHAAQAEEFRLLRECFKEHPESFWERNRRPTVQWNPDLLMRALEDVELVPQADPNTSSHAQRVMKIMALKQLQAANPGLYDEVAIDTAALRAIGWSNPEQFFKPEAARNQPPPEMLKGIEEIKIAHQEADAKTMTAQAAMLKAQQPNAPAAGPQGPQGPHPVELQAKLLSEQNKAKQLDMSFQRDQMNDQNRDLDREKDLRLEQMRMDRDQMNDAVRMQHEMDMQDRDHHSDIVKLAMQVQAQKKREGAK